MESTHYFRLLRRRWLVLLVFAALGAGAGYASTLLGDDEEGPIISYWTASEVLVVPPSETIDLERLAVFATAGDVAASVAADLGIELDDFTPFIRTISDSKEGTIEISVVATGAQSARNQANMLSAALQDKLAADQLDTYTAALDTATNETQRRLDLVSTLDGEILVVDRTVADQEKREAEGELDSNDEPIVVDRLLLDRLGKLNIERDAAFDRYLRQSGTLEDLERAGPPGAVLSPLESISPFQISQFEFFEREALGRQGQTNFTVGEVELADTTPALSVSERLEQPQARAVAGAAAGLALGAMLVLLHLRLDPRLRTREATEAAFGLPVLAEIPLMARRERRKRVLHAIARPRSIITEAHRYLRSLLIYARATNAVTPELNGHGNGTNATNVAGAVHAQPEVRVVMVTSPGAGEGKTTTAANLGAILAEAGYRTVLVNCDHRLPKAHQMLGVGYTPATTVPGGVENLWFVADVARVEGESPAEISRKQRELLVKARTRFDVVIVDTAPLLATNDAIDLLSVTDLVLVVSREARTTGAAAREARELLDRMGTPVAGIVITCAGAGVGRRYYDKYRYGSYYGAAVAKTPVAAVKAEQPKPPPPPNHRGRPTPPKQAVNGDVVKAWRPSADSADKDLRAEVDEMFDATAAKHSAPSGGAVRDPEIDLRNTDASARPEVDIRD